MQIARFFLTLTVNVSERKDNIYPWAGVGGIDSYLKSTPNKQDRILGS